MSQRAIISVDSVHGKATFSVDDGYDGELCPNNLDYIKCWIEEINDSENPNDYFYLVIDESEKDFLKELSESYNIKGIENPWTNSGWG